MLNKLRLAAALGLAALVAGPGSLVLAGPPSLQTGDNLLRNPGFEGEYKGHDPVGNVKVAPNWQPWYIEGTIEQQNDGYGRIAEFFPATEEFDPGATRDGTFAQGLKHDFGTGASGIYQQVTVPANARVRFSVWGKGFSCQPDPGQSCPNNKSYNPSYLGMQIGIDPTGGTDFYASAVAFTPGTSAYDTYEEFIVETDAVGSEVTVFIMYHPRFPVERNKVFWDQASLTVVTGSGSGTTTTSPTPVATTSPTPVPTTGATTVAEAQPASTYTVRAGDTLSAIAQANGVSLSTLINLNGATYPTLFTNPNLIFVGWELRLSSGTTTPTSSTSSGRTYTVQPGDYLGRIGQQNGASVAELISLNSGTYPSLATNPNVIYVGWVLRLP